MKPLLLIFGIITSGAMIYTVAIDQIEHEVNWIQLEDHAPWSTRTWESSIVFKNKLWIYSGKTGREDSWSGEVWTLTMK